MTSDTRATTKSLRLAAAGIRDAVLSFAEESSNDEVLRWWHVVRTGIEEFETDEAPLSELRAWVQSTLEILTQAFAGSNSDAFAALERHVVSLAARVSELMVLLQSDPDALKTADAAVQATAQWLSDTIVRSLTGER